MNVYVFVLVVRHLMDESQPSRTRRRILHGRRRVAPDLWSRIFAVKGIDRFALEPEDAIALAGNDARPLSLPVGFALIS
jgi:hypothetical protein